MVILLLLLALVIWLSSSAPEQRSSASASVRRCPTCGGSVRCHGSTWECEWCGDSGLL